MKKQLVLLLSFALLSGVATAQISLDKLKKAVKGESLSTEEVAAGLKEALTKGASKGSDLVSQVDGY